MDERHSIYMLFILFAAVNAVFLATYLASMKSVECILLGVFNGTVYANLTRSYVNETVVATVKGYSTASVIVYLSFAMLLFFFLVRTGHDEYIRDVVRGGIIGLLVMSVLYFLVAIAYTLAAC